MYYLGIDIGGTNIAIGVVNEEMKIIARGNSKTPTPCPEDVFCDAIVATANTALSAAGITWDDVEEVGVGCPGTVNRDCGVIEFSNNLGYRDFPLQKMLEERMPDVKVILENDANAAAYGEYKAGALKGAKDAVAITLGTGLGGGIIIGGNVYSGFNFAAGELGHNVIVVDGRPCNCGRDGCWERYSSATGLIITTKEYMDKDKSSKMWELVGGDLNKVSGRTAFDGMRAGDATAKKAVDEYIHYLSVGVANVINTFQPDIFCIGGGICNEGETLMAPIREFCEKETYITSKRTKICKAELGNDAGIIGAALLGQ